MVEASSKDCLNIHLLEHGLRQFLMLWLSKPCLYQIAQSGRETSSQMLSLDLDAGVARAVCFDQSIELTGIFRV